MDLIVQISTVAKKPDTTWMIAGDYLVALTSALI